jgi:hypothetical protein
VGRASRSPLHSQRSTSKGQRLEVFAGFVLGILASAIAAIVLDHASRPLLEVVEHNGDRAQGQSPGNPPHEFFHVRVRNRRARLLSGRRPAWSCQATLEVRTGDGHGRLVDPIPARWISQPEPILTLGISGQVAQIPDAARMLAGRRIDIHNHEDQVMSIAVKFEGADECHLFTNESYVFPRWQNPEWSLQPGRHRLRVTVYYERGRAQRDLWLHNDGHTRDDVRIEFA